MEIINFEQTTRYHNTKLLALDQATAYQGIQQMKTARDPQIASEQIDRARQAIEQISRNNKTDRTIWESLRKPVLRIRVCQFLYKAIHQMHMVGMIWGHITHLRQ